MNSRPFIFDSRISRIFDSMARRSIPGYLLHQEYIASTLLKICSDGDSIFDLGASTGTTAHYVDRAIKRAKTSARLQYHICDSSAAMVLKARHKLKSRGILRLFKSAPSLYFWFHHLDIANASELHAFFDKQNTHRCAAVMLIYVLQFIAPALRPSIIALCWEQIKLGGVLLVAEKLSAESPLVQELYQERQYRFKRSNGYSHRAIRKKQESLTDVLIPEAASFYHTIFNSLKGAHYNILYSHGHFQFYIVEKRVP